jgi:serine/threonine protein kinase
MRMLLDVIKGMQYLGFKKIVHRDLKSQNLLVDRSFKVKVADFGLARFSEDTHVKTVNGAAGTPAWMAPEVLRGDPFTAKADVYSFGVVVWETVVREVPWHGLRNAQIVCSVGMREERLPLTHAGFVKYEYLRTLCMACFAEAPQARPNFDQTCEAFTAFLQRLLQEPAPAQAQQQAAQQAPPQPQPQPQPEPEPESEPEA